MNKRQTSQGSVSREDAAAYIAELSLDLAQLARRNGLDTLGYILDMARLEAEAAMRSDDRLAS